jgi:hydrophobic/amphiphilic exporter-1 (mainly G- bacteria), HAE1 family
VKNVVTALNSSVNFDPSFWIDENNGNHYFIGAQYRESDIRNLQTLQDLPVTGANQKSPVLLKNLATFRRTTAPAEVNHLNINRVTDVFANVEGRDVGSVAAEIQRVIDQMEVPSGYRIQMRGEVQSMQESFGGLGFGFLLAVVLVYLVMVAQFRSFLDPFIIMFAVPLGLIGVLVTLWATGTTFNVQSFLGTIFMVGIAVSNSILIVDFANRLRVEEALPVDDALVEACRIRLRPILMTSLAAILALLPMAIGFGRGSEANIPLARAVVGGLFVSTLLTLFVVPVLYQSLKRRAPVPAGPSADLV